jgi:ribosomal protein L32
MVVPQAKKSEERGGKRRFREHGAFCGMIADDI